MSIGSEHWIDRQDKVQEDQGHWTTSGQGQQDPGTGKGPRTGPWTLQYQGQNPGRRQGPRTGSLEDTGPRTGQRTKPGTETGPRTGVLWNKGQ